MTKPTKALVITLYTYVHVINDDIKTTKINALLNIRGALQALGYDDIDFSNIETCEIIWHKDGDYDYV